MSVTHQRRRLVRELQMAMLSDVRVRAEFAYSNDADNVNV